MDHDPRIAPVEDNLLAFIGTLAGLDLFQRLPDDDVTAYFCAVPFPLFNGVSGATFAPGREAARAREVVAAYVARGLPFLWWTTPSTSSPAMAEALAQAGLAREDIPGMHVQLDAPVGGRSSVGVEVAEAGESEVDTLVSTMLAGFDFPDEMAGPMTAVFADFPSEGLVNVLATVDGEPAGCGSAYLTGGTVGLYNIATLEPFRGRGVGYAVTAALMDLGRERGASEAVLHASEQGRPLYERLGFAEVCLVPQYVGIP